MTKDINALLDRGLSSFQAGEWSNALDHFDAVLDKASSHPDALWFKGAALLQLDQIEAAVSLLKQAHQSRPTDAAICNDLGMAFEASTKLDEAAAWFDKAVHLDPAMVHARVNLARLALDRNETNVAFRAITRAIELDANQSVAHNVKGNILRKLGRMDEALGAYEVALSKDPWNSQALLNKGLLLFEQGESDAACQLLSTVCDRMEVSSSIWADAAMTLGLIKAKARDPEGAMDCFDDVLGHHPDHVATRVNRGETKLRQGDLSGADNDFLEVLSLHPDCASAHFNQGQLYLLQERWDEGWDGYNWRWHTASFDSKRRDHDIPEWGGDPGPGLKLHVWGEQGLGDQILFASQIKDAREAGLEVTLEVDPRLVPLFARSGLNGNVFGYDQVPADVLAQCQAQCPLGSLGRVFRRNSVDFSDASPYLQADTAIVAELKDKYEALSEGRTIIGVSWNSVNPKFGIEKSVSLEACFPILQTEEVFFVSLQYGDVQAKIDSIRESLEVDIYVDIGVDHMADLDRAAAQIAAMDLVITSSNTTAHLSGALGRDTWVMVHKTPEWRWGLARKESPWYSHVRIFRQQKTGDWSGPVQAVADALRARVKTYR